MVLYQHAMGGVCLSAGSAGCARNALSAFAITARLSSVVSSSDTPVWLYCSRDTQVRILTLPVLMVISLLSISFSSISSPSGVNPASLGSMNGFRTTGSSPSMVPTLVAALRISAAGTKS